MGELNDESEEDQLEGANTLEMQEGPGLGIQVEALFFVSQYTSKRSLLKASQSTSLFSKTSHLI